MPITVRVVTDAEFASWLEKAKKQFATAPSQGDTQERTRSKLVQLRSQRNRPNEFERNID
jgi:heme/copper-type cytochrome/quinol oxidase subunit 2